MVTARRHAVAGLFYPDDAVNLSAPAKGLLAQAKPFVTPPRFTGDMYAAAELPRVPASLREATDLFKQSAFTRSTFGAEVVEHYTHFSWVASVIGARATA
ncbi:MAG: hypothetical protein ACREYE_23915 [Gammaproteobacteria bacterium]